MDLSRITPAFMGRYTPLHRVARAAVIFSCVAFALIQWYPSQSPTASIPQMPVSYLLLVLLAFFLVFRAVRTWRFLHFPRTLSLAFVCGISQAQRRDTAQSFLIRVGREFLLFALIAIVPFNLLCAVLLRTRSLWELLFLPLLTLALAWSLGWMLQKVVAFIQPAARDRLSHDRALFSMLGYTSPLVLALTARLSACAPAKIRGIVRRDLLYLARCEAVPTILSLFGLPAMAVLMIALIQSQLYGFNTLILLLSAGGFGMATLETLRRSAERLATCSYYPFKRKTIFTARCFLFTTPTALSLLLFGVMTIGRPAIEIIGALSCMVPSLGLLIILTAQLSLSMPARSWEGTFAGAAMLLILVGTFTPVWGGVFPMVGLCAGYTLMHMEPKRRV
jgi:hypothetical protein